MKLSNIFENIPFDSDKELFEILFENKNIKIERIISYGYTSAPNFWYNQSENEFVILLKGEAKLEFKDRVISLNSGDYIMIPKYLQHRVAFTSKEALWLCIYIKE